MGDLFEYDVNYNRMMNYFFGTWFIVI